MIEFNQLLRRLVLWRQRRIPEKRFIIFLSFIVGIVSGLAAVTLKNAIHISIEILEKQFQHGNGYYFLVMPFIGIVLTYLFVKYIIKDDISHGVTRVLYAISKRNSFLKVHNTWSSMVASTLTISFGGSVGAEAPVVLTGASIGSNLARFFKLNYRSITLMLGCGAAGAIAGIFKAPLAGMLFVLEVLMLDLTMASMIPLLISAMTATFIAYFLMGDSVLLSFELSREFTVENVGYYIILGVFCGFIALYFTRMSFRMEGFFKRFTKPTMRILSGALILTSLVIVFPILWGEGYNTVGHILNGEGGTLFQHTFWNVVDPNSFWYLLILAAVLFAKVVAMASTNGSGGVGGIFAPSLLMGSISGYFVVHALNLFFSLGLPESNFALAGMAGVMAAVMHAPMMAIFLIAEITGGYDLILPLILTSTIAYMTIILFEPHSLYTKRLAQRGELMTHHKDKNVLMQLDLKTLVETEFVSIREDNTLRDFVKAVTQTKRNIFPVLDSKGNLVGVVLIENIRNIVFNTELYDTTMVSDFMIAPPAIVDWNDSMEEVMRKFNTSKAWNLPVTQNGEYKGFLSKSKIFNEYREMLLHFSEE